MRKIKTALIGMGRISREHMKSLRSFRDVQVIGVCDLSPAKAEAAAERYGIDRWTTDMDELLSGKPDLVHVTSSAPSHFAITKQLLEHGVGALVEKPIAGSYKDFLSLKGLAEAKGLFLMENHNYQFNPPVQRALDLIRKGEFGDIRHVDITLCLEINRNKPENGLPGGLMMEFLTHLANLSYIFIGPHSRVDASSPQPGELRALVESERGTASIAFSPQVQPSAFRVCIYGSKMTARIDLFESRAVFEKNRSIPRPLMYFSNGLKESAIIFGSSFRSLWSKLKGTPGGYAGLHALLRKTYDALESHAQPPIPLEQVDQVNRLVFDMATQVASKEGA